MIQPINTTRPRFDVYVRRSDVIYYDKQVKIVGWGTVSAPVSQSIMPPPRVLNLRTNGATTTAQPQRVPVTQVLPASQNSKQRKTKKNKSTRESKDVQHMIPVAV
jgi:hypothetical protein